VFHTVSCESLPVSYHPEAVRHRQTVTRNTISRLLRAVLGRAPSRLCRRPPASRR
jgi:hypothetical protein